MSKRALRFTSEAEMPPAMQQLYRQQLQAIAPPQAPSAVTRAAAPAPKPNKYGNARAVVDGIRFDSKREAKYYGQLKVRKAAGEVAYWLRQVPVHLPCGTRYVVDFLVFFVDGRAPEYVDVKGRETEGFRIKKRGVEHHYPIRIVLA